MSTPRGPGISIGVRDLLLFGKGEVALGVVPPDGSGCLIVCYGRLLCRVERPKPSPGACICVRVVFRFVSGSVEGLGLMPIHDGRQQTVHSRPFKTIQDHSRPNVPTVGSRISAAHLPHGRWRTPLYVLFLPLVPTLAACAPCFPPSSPAIFAIGVWYGAALDTGTVFIWPTLEEAAPPVRKTPLGVCV